MPPILISFSGLDGSGKSTQIENLRAFAVTEGFTVRQLTFWDNVVVGASYREGFVHKVYRSEKGIGLPGKPVARRDKNVRKWYLSLARHALYLLDALNLCRVAARERRSGADIILFDRYIYDEFANLPLASGLSRAFVRLITGIVPRPDIAYLLDADPEAARARKPEYPVEFMRECRDSYYQLAALLGTMSLIPPLPLEQTRQATLDIFMARIPEACPPSDSRSKTA